MVELRAFKVNKLEVENTVAPGTQLKLQNQVKYNVNYMDGDKKCIGILELRVADADLQPFEIKIEAVAEFAYGDEDAKPDIHTSSFDQLFPFVREIIHNVTGYRECRDFLSRLSVLIRTPSRSAALMIKKLHR